MSSGVKPNVRLITVGPTIEAIVTMTTTMRPKTASLFLSSRRHASRHSDVPCTNAPVSSGIRSASATAISGPMWISSSSSGFFSVAIANLLVAHARIEIRVSDINQQIHQQECDRNKRNDPDDQRLVAIQRRLNEVVSQSRQRKNPL